MADDAPPSYIHQYEHKGVMETMVSAAMHVSLGTFIQQHSHFCDDSSDAILSRELFYIYLVLLMMVMMAILRSGA